MIIATCNRGMEEICSKEAREITGKEAKKEANGLVRIETDWKDAFKLNYTAKTMNRIILLLGKGYFKNLDDIYKKALGMDYSFIGRNQTFAVRFSRHGEHDFNRMDVERMVGKAVIESYEMDKKIRLKVDLEEPDVMIRGFIKNNQYWIGIDTTGGSLHKRGYRKYQHPAPLQTTIANGLIRLAEWKDSMSLYDPCCGSGTIPIEAYLYGNRVPNKWKWDKLLIWKLKIFDKNELMREKETLDGKEEKKKLELYGSDISPKHIEGARINAASAGAAINFFVMDVEKASFDHDVIITNPPYGKRVSSKKAAKKINKILDEKIIKGGCKKAIIFTAEESNLENYKKKHAILYGKLWSFAFIYEF